jgi:hypothetical protein
MKLTAFLLVFVNGYKTHVSATLAVVSGLGMILTKDYEGIVSQILQALTLIFGGTSIVGLRHAVAKLEGSSKVGLRHAVADGTPNSSTAGNTN